MVDPFEYLIELKGEIELINTKIANLIHVGPVAESDPNKGYRIQLGEGPNGEAFLSPWIPHPETGKTSIPLKKGQLAVALNANGDPRQSQLVPGGYGGQHATPNTDMEANVFEDAGVRLTIKGGCLNIEADKALTISIGGVTHTITSAGLNTDGGKLIHDGKNYGSTHTHGGVDRGNSNTNGPN